MMFIKRVLSYRNAWDILKKNNSIELAEFACAIDFQINKNTERYYSIDENEEYLNVSLKIRENLKEMDWFEDCSNKKNSNFIDRSGYIGGIGHLKNGISIKNYFNEEDTLLWVIKDIQEKFSLQIVNIAIQYTTDLIFFEKESSYFEIIKKLLNNFKEVPLEVPFLIVELSSEQHEIEVIEINSKSINIERSIEFKPEHYQAGLGILNYFGTVMRKKYPEQNAKVRIEQDDHTVRLVVESANGDKEIIERAFDEFGLVIHQDIKPEDFYYNYLDVAELKTKLSTFESELKFQHQLVEMKEHRIIELEEDRTFLKNVISQALIRANSPVYINNHLNNSQKIAFNPKAEINQSYDLLDELIDFADKDSLKKRLERALAALDSAQKLDEPEEVKNSGGMKQLAKILNEANEVGSEVNDLVEQGGKAVELMKNLGRTYNSVAEWCGLPVIPSVFVKE